MLESQLHNEQFRQSQMEIINESMRSQLVEAQKQLTSGDALPLPDGFTLIETSHLDQILAENKRMAQQLERLSPETLTKLRKKSLPNTKPLPGIGKSRSEMVQKRSYQNREASGQKVTRSQCRFPSAERPLASARKVPFVETNIGDTCENIPERGESCDEDILKVFMKKRTNPSDSLMNMNGRPDEREQQY